MPRASLALAAHNPKVAGSNPAPATKSTRPRRYLSGGAVAFVRCPENPKVASQLSGEVLFLLRTLGVVCFGSRRPVATALVQILSKKL
jgi:hypothetical protein